uniref:Autophagy-related protein 13 n=1 Tax=Parastrongyloides trichosuri TaxID=131310 RepID=A0A0N4ZCC3_PARTI
MPDEVTQAQYNDFAKFVKFLSTRLIQVIVQARMGEKLSHKCTPDPHLSDWFNLKIDEIGEVAKYLKKNVLHFPPKIDAVNIDFYLYTSDSETLPLETWSLYVDSSNVDNSINVRTDLYHRMGTLLKSVYSSSRVLPSYRYYVRKQSSETYVILYRIYNGPVDEKAFGENHKFLKLGELPSPFGYVCLDVRYRTSMKISVYDDEKESSKEEVFEKSNSETSETTYKNATKPITIVPKIGSQIVAVSPMSDFGTTFGTSPGSLDIIKNSPKDHPRFMLGRSHSSSDESSSHSFMKPTESMSDEALASAIFQTSTTQLHGTPYSYNFPLKQRTRHNSLPFEALLNDSPLTTSQHSSNQLPILTEETFMSGSKSTMSLMPLKTASSYKSIRHSHTIPSRVDNLNVNNFVKNNPLNSSINTKNKNIKFTTHDEDDILEDCEIDDTTEEKKEEKIVEDDFYVHLFPVSSMESLGDNLREFERECRLAPEELPSFPIETHLNFEDQLSQFQKRQSSFDNFVAQINEKRGSSIEKNQE